MVKSLLLLLLLSCSLTEGFSQIDKIDTDRPDQTESAVIVPKKWTQLEMGFMREKEKTAPGMKDLYLQHPTLLGKYGLVKRFELRLITEVATVKEEVGSPGTELEFAL